MTISLTTQQIDTAIHKLSRGLEQYLRLQSKVAGSDDFHEDTEFQTDFNHFYRVRRSAVWRESFYSLMARAKREHLQFDVILDLLFQKTTRYEASFASQLYATLNPSAPVIDSMVLRNLGLRLPYSYMPDRAAKICTLHQKLSNIFTAFLKTENGQYLIREFKCTYPTAVLTDEKKLDLVLWKTR